VYWTGVYYQIARLLGRLVNEAMSCQGPRRPQSVRPRPAVIRAKADAWCSGSSGPVESGNTNPNDALPKCRTELK